MANSFKNTQAVSNEVQYQFETANIATATFNRQYDQTKTHRGTAEGEIIEIEQPFRTMANEGSTYVNSPIQEYTVPLARAKQFHVGLAVTASELALNMAKKDIKKMYAQKYLSGACATLGAKVDSYALGEALNRSYNLVGTVGVNPSSYSDITAPRAVLENERAPAHDRFAVLAPNSISSLNSGTVSLFNPSKEKSDDYRSGHIGNTNEFTFYSTPNLPRHTNGSCSDSSLVVSVEPTEGASVISVSGGTANGTITRGSVISFEEVYSVDSLTKENRSDIRYFVVDSDVTLNGSGAGTIAVTVPFTAEGAYKHVSALPAVGAVVTIEGDASTSYSQNLYHQRDAHVIAFVDLPEIGVSSEMMLRNEELGTGFSAKICSDGDIKAYDNTSRLDVLLGTTTPNPWWSVKSFCA